MDRKSLSVLFSAPAATQGPLAASCPLLHCIYFSGSAHDIRMFDMRIPQRGSLKIQPTSKLRLQDWVGGEIKRNKWCHSKYGSILSWDQSNTTSRTPPNWRTKAPRGSCAMSRRKCCVPTLHPQECGYVSIRLNIPWVWPPPARLPRESRQTEIQSSRPQTRFSHTQPS